ncbi:MAG: hypothetical protein RKO25_07475 [Candidatus Contendobacter sp.]|nr:hypothetical protein [Candidatus Contendobacter sp.]
MSEFLQEMNKLVDELELRTRKILEAAIRHDEERSDESRSELRLAIAYVKPLTKAMKYTLKTPNYK